MGCSQSILESYETATTVSETTCRSTYGPQYLTSIPTTTRITTSNIVTTERPLQWSTSCAYTQVPFTITETRFIVVTETAPRTIGIPTSTGTAYVSSTVYETVGGTVHQTETAPAVTIAPEPSTVSAPIDFTPIASNPANAGADRFTAVELSSVITTTQEEQPMETMTDDTDDAITVVPPGRLLVTTGLHIRAEKSFSNVNRVICDETTRFYTTSVKPFTVRHSTLTSTVTWTYWNVYTTIFQDIVSTATEFPVDYEEATEIVAITETATSLTYETTTVTPTYELSELPRPTTYAACGANNIIGGIGGYGIVSIDAQPRGRSGISTVLMEAYRSPQSCCEACVSQIERTCAGSVWGSDICFFILTADSCNGSEAVISFDVSRGGEVAANEGYLLSNGACGQQVWSGRYCDLSGNCAVDPAASSI